MKLYKEKYQIKDKIGREKGLPIMKLSQAVRKSKAGLCINYISQLLLFLYPLELACSSIFYLPLCKLQRKREIDREEPEVN